MSCDQIAPSPTPYIRFEMWSHEFKSPRFVWVMFVNGSLSYFLPNTNSNSIAFLCVNLRVLWNSFAHIFSSALIGHRNCWYQGSKQDWFNWPGNVQSYYPGCSWGNANDYTDQRPLQDVVLVYCFWKKLEKGCCE